MKNYFFDLDGTLTEPEEGITKCFIYALEKLKAPIPTQEELRNLIGPPIQDSFLVLMNGNAELAAQGLALYRERFSKIGLFENYVYPDIPKLLGDLKMLGKNLYVATSKPHVYAIQILEHFKLAPYFVKIYGSELNGVRANKKELLAYLLESESLEAQNCVMIGDRNFDVLGAKANNIPSIGILWGHGSREEHTKAGANYIVNTPGEILNIFQ